MPSRTVAASSLRASRVASTSASAARPIARRALATAAASTPAPTALSALASRLSLPPNPTLHPQLLACLTHPSYATSSVEATTTPTNSLLSPLGNTLLGMFATEHLAQLYPLLPTAALQNAVSAHVGPAACFSIARELGVGVTGGDGGFSQGIPVRWTRRDRAAVAGKESVPVAPGFRDVESSSVSRSRKEAFEDVVADSVRAFVGLVYQELGMHAARKFTHAHFLSRHLDLKSIFKFSQPKYMLAQTVKKYLLGAGVSADSGAGRIETRILAETGRHTQSPLFNVGLFLPSGLKLAEGFGSSLKMAEHRACVNALLSIFLVRSDSTAAAALPTSLHGETELETAFKGMRLMREGSEVLAGSSTRKSGWKAQTTQES